MTLNSIKNALRKYDLKVWQLAKQLDCSRSHFYDLSHNNFKGNETAVKNAIKDLISKEVK